MSEAVHAFFIVDSQIDAFSVARLRDAVLGSSDVSAIISAVGGDFASTAEALRSDNPRVHLQCETDRMKLAAALARSGATTIAYVPAGVTVLSEDLSSFRSGSRQAVIQPLIPTVAINASRFSDFPVAGCGWMADFPAINLFLSDLIGCEAWDLGSIAELEHERQYSLAWRSCPVGSDNNAQPEILRDEAVGPTPPQILAIVPHYKCEVWLRQCLRSLTSQTRPPDAIAVIDDGSGHAPREIVEEFPAVTLLSVADHIGPERIVNGMIFSTSYSAYLIQDSDDWAACDRLERLLSAMQASGAEMIGCQEFQYYPVERRFNLRTYPLDVNAAMSRRAGHYLLHGSSLISRALALRLGGFDISLKLVGDSDFLFRASRAGRVRNIPWFSYFRRCRPDSLSNHPLSGLGSSARRAETIRIKMKAKASRKLQAAGGMDSAAVEPGPVAQFLRECGPALEWRAPAHR